VHGLIHLLGVTNAFGVTLPQLTQPKGRAYDESWLVAALASRATVVAHAPIGMSVSTGCSG
jgi:hypothetical protein